MRAVITFFVSIAFLLAATSTCGAQTRFLKLSNATEEDVVIFVQFRWTSTPFVLPRGKSTTHPLNPTFDDRLVVAYLAAGPNGELAVPASIIAMSKFRPPAGPSDVCATLVTDTAGYEIIYYARGGDGPVPISPTDEAKLKEAWEKNKAAIDKAEGSPAKAAKPGL